jgi:hypothetical protein
LYTNSVARVAEWDAKKIVKAVNMVLAAVGLKLVSSCKRATKSAPRSYTYMLDSDRVCKMMELVALKTRRTRGVPDNAHAAAALAKCPLTKYASLLDPERRWTGVEIVDDDD